MSPGFLFEMRMSNMCQNMLPLLLIPSHKHFNGHGLKFKSETTYNKVSPVPARTLSL